jgi:hypothetical protein
MLALFQKKWPVSTEARIDGRPVTIAVRVSTRARSYRLSIPHRGGPVLTVPRHGRWAEAEAFLNRQTSWLAARLKRSVQPVAFAEGARVPVRGIDHLIVGTGKVRGRVEVIEVDDAPALLVPGDAVHMPRRLTDWLKAEAQKDLEARVLVHAERLGVTAKSVRFLREFGPVEFQLAADPCPRIRARLRRGPRGGASAADESLAAVLVRRGADAPRHGARPQLAQGERVAADGLRVRGVGGGLPRY